MKRPTPLIVAFLLSLWITNSCTSLRKKPILSFNGDPFVQLDTITKAPPSKRPFPNKLSVRATEKKSRRILYGSAEIADEKEMLLQVEEPEIEAAAVENNSPHTNKVIRNRTPAGAPPPISTATHPNPAQLDTWPQIKTQLHGILGFCYFKTIYTDEYKDFVVFLQLDSNLHHSISKELMHAHMEELRQMKKALNDNTKDFCDTIFVPQIIAYDSVRVWLEVTTHHFSIKNFNIPSTQLIDIKKGNYWMWRLYPMVKENTISDITVHFQALLPNGALDTIKNNPINVKVTIRPVGMWARFMSFSKEVYFLYTALLIPLFAWWRKRIKVNKQAAKS